MLKIYEIEKMIKECGLEYYLNNLSPIDKLIRICELQIEKDEEKAQRIYQLINKRRDLINSLMLSKKNEQEVYEDFLTNSLTKLHSTINFIKENKK